MDNKKIANLLFPNVKTTIADLEKKFPPRTKNNKIVTRFAPSPTGQDMHFGHLFSCLISSRLVQSENGTFFLRVEDTDKKREVEGSICNILKTLARHGIHFDEGPTICGCEKGEYGPYTQSKRGEIYETVAKHLVEKGLAYPCFCTEEDISAIRETQSKMNLSAIGYYGEFAKCSFLTEEEIEKNLAENKPFVIRFRCPYVHGQRMKYVDLLKGEIELDANINHVVILKTDKIPPYNFAHVVDDHFMRTNLVIRGEEYSGTPTTEHQQLFDACGFERIQYMHNPYIQIVDEKTHSKRKLSKRKDLEASMFHYANAGFPVEGLIEYLLGLMNSNFESWRKQNPTLSNADFPFSVKKISKSGALLDIAKLKDVCKNVISRFSAKKVFEETLEWAKENNKEWFDVLENNKDFAISMFSIDREGNKPRKDIAIWSETPSLFGFFFHEIFKKTIIDFGNFEKSEVSKIFGEYISSFDEKDEKDVWFEKIKVIAENNGYCTNMKEFKQDPQKFKGSVADVSTMIRLAVTTKTQSPDLFAICSLLGKAELEERKKLIFN